MQDSIEAMGTNSKITSAPYIYTQTNRGPTMSAEEFRKKFCSKPTKPILVITKRDKRSTGSDFLWRISGTQLALKILQSPLLRSRPDGGGRTAPSGCRECGCETSTPQSQHYKYSQGLLIQFRALEKIHLGTKPTDGP
jgi:hypothetical protein